MKIYYHLPGLFEFYRLYALFLPLFHTHREYFYDWCEIGSIYGAPGDCLWGGGRVGFGEDSPEKVSALLRAYGVSARLTFSNSLLRRNIFLIKSAMISVPCLKIPAPFKTALSSHRIYCCAICAKNIPLCISFHRQRRF